MIAWFVSTRIGRWLATAVAVLLAIGTAWLAGSHRGAKAQAATDDAKAAQADAAAKAAAHSLYKESSEAANAVKQQAAAQPPPNVDQRDDFNNTGFGS